MSVSENLWIWEIQYLNISESEHFNILISQNLSILVCQYLRISASEYLSISESENLGSLKSQIIINNDMVLPLPVHQKYGFQFWDLEILGWEFQDFLLKSHFFTGFQQIFRWRSWENSPKISHWKICLKFLWDFLLIFSECFSSELFCRPESTRFGDLYTAGHCWGMCAGWSYANQFRVLGVQNLRIFIS